MKGASSGPLNFLREPGPLRPPLDNVPDIAKNYELKIKSAYYKNTFIFEIVSEHENLITRLYWLYSK
jgi:hypothetical protein